MTIIAGVDGGGTKTICALSDGRGEFIGSARSGPSNFLLVGERRATESLASAILEACDKARVDRVDTACFGLAGCGRPQGKATGRRIIESVMSRPQAPKLGSFQVTSDAMIALEGAFGGSAGIVLISGTGSMALGGDGRGRYERAGGWGRILDDEGSSYDVGHRALVEVMKSYDGRRGPSSLQEKVEDLFGVSDRDEMVLASLRKDFHHMISGLAPLVFSAAREGDGAAICIVERAGKDLAEMVSAVAKKLQFNDNFNLAYSGGMFKDADIILPVLTKELTGRGQRFEIKKPLLPAVGGAIGMAKRMIGQKSDEDFLRRLARGLTEAGIA